MSYFNAAQAKESVDWYLKNKDILRRQKVLDVIRDAAITGQRLIAIRPMFTDLTKEDYEFFSSLGFVVSEPEFYVLAGMCTEKCVKGCPGHASVGCGYIGW